MGKPSLTVTQGHTPMLTKQFYQLRTKHSATCAHGPFSVRPPQDISSRPVSKGGLRDGGSEREEGGLSGTASLESCQKDERFSMSPTLLREVFLSA